MSIYIIDLRIHTSAIAPTLQEKALTKWIGAVFLILAALLKFGLTAKLYETSSGTQSGVGMLISGATVMAVSFGIAVLAWHWVNER